MLHQTSLPRPKQPLFQVTVETRKGKTLRVGPAMVKEACSQFAGVIHEQIKLGREKRWSNPQIVPILNLEN